jgi:hypothetical protein
LVNPLLLLQLPARNRVGADAQRQRHRERDHHERKQADRQPQA